MWLLPPQQSERGSDGFPLVLDISLPGSQVPSHLMCRKLLREDQLEPVTKAAQQEELERRKRLEQQRKDYAAPIPTVPLEFLPGEQWRWQERPRAGGGDGGAQPARRSGTHLQGGCDLSGILSSHSASESTQSGESPLKS